MLDGPIQTVSILNWTGSASDRLTLNVLHGDLFGEGLRVSKGLGAEGSAPILVPFIRPDNRYYRISDRMNV